MVDGIKAQEKNAGKSAGNEVGEAAELAATEAGESGDSSTAMVVKPENDGEHIIRKGTK